MKTHRVGEGSLVRDGSGYPLAVGVAAHAGDVSRETGRADPAALGDPQIGPDDPRVTDPTMEVAFSPSMCGHGASGLIFTPGAVWRARIGHAADAWLGPAAPCSCAARCVAVRTLMCADASCGEAAGYIAVVPSGGDFTDRVVDAWETAISGGLLCRDAFPRTSSSRRRVPCSSDAAGGSRFWRRTGLDPSICFT